MQEARIHHFKDGPIYVLIWGLTSIYVFIDHETKILHYSILVAISFSGFTWVAGN